VNEEVKLEENEENNGKRTPRSGRTSKR